MSGGDRATFYIGELAERTGMTRDTIRFYEDVGVMPVPDRTASGYRIYSREDAERLGFIGQAQTLGLKLEEIADVLELVDEGTEPCRHVEARLRERLAEVEDRMEELKALRGRLHRALRRAEGEPAPGGCRCGIIEGTEEEARGERAPPKTSPGG